MPLVKEREYRALAAPLSAAAVTKRIQTDYYVEGYATTFNSPYLLFEFQDGWKYYERIDSHALDGADMSDVIMQYDHAGRVFARTGKTKSLIIQPDNVGLFMCADLGRTEAARGLYQDIAAELVTKMSWAFVVAKDSITEDRNARTIIRDVLEIKKVYDVSAVSRPANEETEISARSFATRSYEQIQAEYLERRAKLLKLKTML